MTPTLTILLLVILSALSDSLNFRGNKTAGHALRYIELPGLIAATFVCGITGWVDTGLFILAYGFIRFALFSYIWNIVTGQHWTYVGVVDPVDRFLSKFPAHGVLFARVVFLIVGIAITIKEL